MFPLNMSGHRAPTFPNARHLQLLESWQTSKLPSHRLHAVCRLTLRKPTWVQLGDHVGTAHEPREAGRGNVLYAISTDAGVLQALRTGQDSEVQ